MKTHRMRTFFLIAFSCFLIFQSIAQVGYNKVTLAESIYKGTVRKFLSADMNGDGTKDIVFSTLSGFIGWFENGGQIDFELYKSIFEENGSIRDFIIHDVDNDGDPDILVATSTHILWCENLDGLASFSMPKIISEVMNVSVLEVGDIDGDGDFDIAAVGLGPAIWLENTGDVDNFILHELASGITHNRQLIIVDIDDDGDNDIIYSGNKGLIEWMENLDGLGNFSENINLGGFSTNPSITTMDIDSDGDLDILYAYSRIGWIENLGDGEFNSRSTIEEYDLGFPRFQDLDNDSVPDIVSVDEDGIHFTYNKGEFIFETTTLSVEGRFTYENIYDDFDMDGDIDYCGYRELSVADNMIVHRNDNNTQFADVGRLQYFRRNYSAIELADIDGDNDVDFIVEDSKNETISWFENDGQYLQDWAPHVIIDTSASESVSSSTNISIADLDGDADLDIVKNYNSESLYWLENIDGNGNFGAPVHIVDIEDEVIKIITTDMNNDGYLDVLVGFDDNVGLYLSEDGNGMFRDKIEVYRGNQLSNVKVADLDGDNFMDVVLSMPFDGGYWQKNLNGGQSFGDTIPLYQLAFMDNLIRDIDNDGDEDFILTAFSQGMLQLLINDGLGNFASMGSEVTGGFSRILLTSDIDNDGDEDILIHRFNNDDFGWLENYGFAGGFSDYKYLLSNVGINQIIQVSENNFDVDNDGDEDFMIAHKDEVYLFENRNAENHISGLVRFSNDVNDCDASAFSLKNMLVEARSDTEILTTNTNATGNYSLLAIEGSYTTTIIPTNENLESNPEEHENDFLGSGELVVNDFCLTPISAVNDLSIDIYSSGLPRPGFDHDYRIVYTNEGTTLMDGQVVFEFDQNVISFIESNTAIEAQQSNSLTFAFADLLPLESRTIILTFKVGLIPDVMLGDDYIISATILPISNDIEPEDNVVEYVRTIVGSYDPNDIQVMEGPQILVSETQNYLHYLIRFQNTGSFPAENVRITNSLDDQLDYRNLMLGESSHPYTMKITNRKDIEFRFDNINLPDSINNEPESHGFISYKIKPHPDFSLGDIVYNDADIFFDFNPPIQTNTVSTEVVETLSIEDIQASKVRLYPNPVDNHIIIDSEEIISNIEIIDVYGNKTSVIGDKETLNFAPYTPGIYFLEIHLQNGSSVTKKVIKI